MEDGGVLAVAVAVALAAPFRPLSPVPTTRLHLLSPIRRYSAADYRDRLYREIARRKKDAKEAKERKAAAGTAGAGVPGPAGSGAGAMPHNPHPR
jgi:hypothetical protein